MSTDERRSYLCVFKLDFISSKGRTRGNVSHDLVAEGDVDRNSSDRRVHVAEKEGRIEERVSDISVLLQMSQGFIMWPVVCHN